VTPPVVTPPVTPPPVTPPIVTPPSPTSPGGTAPTSGTVNDETSAWAPVIAAPVGLALAVIGRGVTLPAEQLALAQPAPQPVTPEAPVVEQPAPAAEREEAARKARVPIVYPRKQARN
jgi:hypothetical protein